jgi:hypothetical protein
LKGLLRQEAVSVVKEIGASCKLLNPKRINLESPVADHYEIHIESAVDDENWRCLKDIAKKRNLGIKLTDETLIIYKNNK